MFEEVVDKVGDKVVDKVGDKVDEVVNEDVNEDLKLGLPLKINVRRKCSLRRGSVSAGFTPGLKIFLQISIFANIHFHDGVGA